MYVNVAEKNQNAPTRILKLKNKFRDHKPGPWSICQRTIPVIHLTSWN